VTANRPATYDITVTFFDEAGQVVDLGHGSVGMSAGRARTVKVPMDHPGKVSDVSRCEAEVMSR
jgi:hypothetical protein